MSKTVPPSGDLLNHIDQEFGAAIARLDTFLRIPSIGTDPAYDADTRRAADWLVEQLTEIGFDASARPTPGQPMVVAHCHEAGPDAPHLLYYGHYDVQPADPLELWDSPPFEPSIVESAHGKKIVARGAVDDKGQVMTWLEAMRAWRAVRGKFPVNLSVLCEGEEESSSKSMVPFLKTNADELTADVCVISDTGMLGVDQPAMTTILRGLAYLEVEIEGPSHDLHSGMYGGVALNPIHVLSKIIAELHGADGRVMVDGFYDRIIEPTAADLAGWDAAGIDQQAFVESIGLSQSHGERGQSVMSQIWARPCLDINGIWGGYTGEGSKTVIPCKAHAKLSCRLVPGQDSAQIMGSIKNFFQNRLPADAKITFHEHGRGNAIKVPDQSVFMDAAKSAAAKVFDRDAVLIGCGGSIPIVTWLKQHLGMDSLLLGFALDDDRMHSPNEKFELTCLERGIKTHALMLNQLAASSG